MVLFSVIIISFAYRGSALTHVDIGSTVGLRSLMHSPFLSYKRVLYLLPGQTAIVLLPGELHVLFSYRYRLFMGDLDSNFCRYFHRWTNISYVSKIKKKQNKTKTPNHTWERTFSKRCLEEKA